MKQVLSVADSDPWRQGVRAAREKNDRQEMEKLAREVDTAGQPPEALFVLEMGLAQRGATEAALALCDAPSRLSRETSGSTTTWAWHWAIATRHRMRRPFDS